MEGVTSHKHHLRPSEGDPVGQRLCPCHAEDSSIHLISMSLGPSQVVGPGWARRASPAGPTLPLPHHSDAAGGPEEAHPRHHCTSSCQLLSMLARVAVADPWSQRQTVTVCGHQRHVGKYENKLWTHIHHAALNCTWICNLMFLFINY